MGAIFTSHQTDPSHPFINKTGILPGAEMALVINPAREDVIVNRSASPFEPCQQTGSRIGEQLRLNGPTCFLLHYDRARSDLSATDKVADLHLHQVAASELAVDRQIEQRSIPQTAALIEIKTDSQICFGFRARFAPTALPAFQTWRLAVVGSASSVSMFVLQWPDWPVEERLPI